mmetsp:Transcript_33142/g.50684  ORF Transcript_33142/g.50684 Transcript_33142/m.50684 type:complete len:338 (-) Transcript_33142:126-1139(-)
MVVSGKESILDDSKADVVHMDGSHDTVAMLNKTTPEITIYDCKEKQRVQTIPLSKPCDVVRLTKHTLVAVATSSGAVYCFKRNDKGQFVADKTNDAPLVLPKDEMQIVHVAIHPCEQYILLSTKSGRVYVCSFASIVTYFEAPAPAADDDSGVEYTAGALHPDGLIYAAGTSKGEVHLWDLNNQSLGVTFTPPPATADGGSSSGGSRLKCLTFSENGYHLFAATNQNVQVWDLRKATLVSTFPAATTTTTTQQTSSAIDMVVGDASGKYICYGSNSNNNVSLEMIKTKDWNRVIHSLSLGDGGVLNAMHWGPNAKYMVSCHGGHVFLYTCRVVDMEE